MQYKLDLRSHSVYSLHYHFIRCVKYRENIQCVKYRRKALTNPLVIDFLKTKIHNISETFDVEVLNIECDKDHFHYYFQQNLRLIFQNISTP
nr:transposase [Methanosarcina sp. WH1]